jgi:hypothetical protein
VLCRRLRFGRQFDPIQFSIVRELDALDGRLQKCFAMRMSTGITHAYTGATPASLPLSIDCPLPPATRLR